METHDPFGAKWITFCHLKVRNYIMIANMSGTLKVAPLRILKFPVVLPHKFSDAEKFNLQFSDANEITEIADKLRWYRYQKCLRQRDVADYVGIDRSTYIHYEEYDVLHTTGYQYINNDIDIYLQARNAVFPV